MKHDPLYDDSEEMASDPEIQKYAVKNDGLQWGMGTLANEKKWPAFPKAKKADVVNEQRESEEGKKRERGEEGTAEGSKEMP